MQQAREHFKLVKHLRLQWSLRESCIRDTHYTTLSGTWASCLWPTLHDAARYGYNAVIGASPYIFQLRRMFSKMLYQKDYAHLRISCTRDIRKLRYMENANDLAVNWG